MTLVDGSIGELVGQDYVARYFPPSSKAKMVELIANLKTAMAARIETNNWMSAATKKAAVDKLAKMDVMVGYPDKFRDYSALRSRPTTSTAMSSARAPSSAPTTWKTSASRWTARSGA